MSNHKVSMGKMLTFSLGEQKKTLSMNEDGELQFDNRVVSNSNTYYYFSSSNNLELGTIVSVVDVNGELDLVPFSRRYTDKDYKNIRAFGVVVANTPGDDGFNSYSVQTKGVCNVNVRLTKNITTGTKFILSKGVPKVDGFSMGHKKYLGYSLQDVTVDKAHPDVSIKMFINLENIC